MRENKYITLTVITIIAAYIIMTFAFTIIQGDILQVVREDTYIPLHDREDNTDILVEIAHEYIADKEIQNLTNDADFEMADDATRIEMATEVFDDLLNRGYILEYNVNNNIYITYTDALKHNKSIRIKELSPEEKEVGNTWLIQG